MQQAVETNRFSQKLFKNTGAIIGLCIIVLAVFIALSCYQLAPDASPFGNRMIPAIGSKSPGFTMRFLLIKQSDHEESGVLTKWMSDSPKQASLHWSNLHNHLLLNKNFIWVQISLEEICLVGF
jgi:peptide/nickel transport system permease protein